MAYTIIFIPKHNPHHEPRTLTLPRWLVIALPLAIVLLPIALFWVGYDVLAPTVLKNRLEAQTDEFVEISSQNKELSQKYNRLDTAYRELQKNILAETNRRAEAEARVTILENARATALEKLEQTEQKVIDLNNKLSMYEDIFRPASEALQLQCFNISIDSKRDSIDYSVQLMKTDKNDRKELPLTVKFRVLTGPSVLSLGEGMVDDADRVKETSLDSLRQLTGSIRGEFSGEGVRMLDIRAYEKGTDRLAGHCWKAF